MRRAPPPVGEPTRPGRSGRSRRATGPPSLRRDRRIARARARLGRTSPPSAPSPLRGLGSGAGGTHGSGRHAGHTGRERRPSRGGRGAAGPRHSWSPDWDALPCRSPCGWFACTWRRADDPLHRSGDGESNGLDMMRPEDPSMDEAPGTTTREDQIRAATIGEPSRADGPIHLAEYDPEWPRALRARGGAGPRRSWATGSACSSMPARPRSRGCRPSRSSTWSWPSRTRPTKPPTSRRWRPPATSCASASPTGTSTACSRGRTPNVNLHTFSDGLARRSSGCSPSATACAPTTTSASRYLATKRELAARHWAYVQDYADAKGEVVEGIIERAFADRDERPSSLTASAAIDTVRERT